MVETLADHVHLTWRDQPTDFILSAISACIPRADWPPHSLSRRLPRPLCRGARNRFPHRRRAVGGGGHRSDTCLWQLRIRADWFRYRRFRLARETVLVRVRQAYEIASDELHMRAVARHYKRTPEIYCADSVAKDTDVRSLCLPVTTVHPPGAAQTNPRTRSIERRIHASVDALPSRTARQSGHELAAFRGRCARCRSALPNVWYSAVARHPAYVR